MDNQSKHFRHIMLFYYKKGKNAAATWKKIAHVYGEDAVTESTVRRWFVKFRAGNFDLEDADRPGRPSAVDDDQIKVQIETNPRLTTREIAEAVGVPKSTVHDHLVKLGYISRYDIWVPHNLSEKNCMDRFSICDMLIKRNETSPFLRQVVTGDEKWIVYDNAVRKRSWGQSSEPPQAAPKANIHQKKVMLCVWWDFKGVIYYELLPQNQTINSDVYCCQLDNLNQEIKEKRPELANRKGVLLHQDNARPHVSSTTRRKIYELGWDVLPHPPYSPDIAPSDYHLFRSLQNSLNGKSFVNYEAVKRHVEEFFESKPVQFYTDGILKLPERWAKVVEQNGKYFIE